MRRRGRRTIGIRGEELVGVLYGVGGSRMWMMVQPVVLPSLRILLEVVGLAVHREERRGGRKTGQAKPQNATSLAAQAPALPTRCRVAVTHSHVSFGGRPMRPAAQSTATVPPYKPALSSYYKFEGPKQFHCIQHLLDIASYVELSIKTRVCCRVQEPREQLIAAVAYAHSESNKTALFLRAQRGLGGLSVPVCLTRMTGIKSKQSSAGS